MLKDKDLINQLQNQINNEETTKSLLTIIAISKMLSENIPDLIYLSEGVREISQFVADEILTKLKGEQFQDIKKKVNIINKTTKLFEIMALKSLPLMKTGLKGLEVTLEAKSKLEGFIGKFIPSS